MSGTPGMNIVCVLRGPTSKNPSKEGFEELRAKAQRLRRDDQGGNSEEIL